MILREPRFGPIKRSELGFFPRVVTESKLFGVGLVAGAVGLYGGLLTQLSDGALAGYADLFSSSKLVSVSTVDFLILSLFAFEPIKEDMSRRGWWGCYGENNVGRLAAFCFPVLGPAAYVLLRPAPRGLNNNLENFELAVVVPELRLVRVVEARQRGHVGTVVFFDVTARRVRDFR